MLKSSKKNIFSAPLFVIASLGAFAVFGALFIFVILEFGYRNMAVPRQAPEDPANRYYINTDFNEDDPYITKKPDLKDMLKGPIITDSDPSMGDKYAPVVIVYFADFECDFCRKQEQVLKRLIQNYRYQTKLVWKDYPENDISSPSFQAAIAARCAGEQNLFWQYHDFLYELNGELNRETFDKIADLISLDKSKFDDCLDIARPKKGIFDNIEEANALDINGVPFLYVNDQEIMGGISYEDLEKIVQIELKKAEK